MIKATGAGATGARAAGVDSVTDTDFDDEVLKAGLPVLVEFTADWCPPCRQLAPVLSAVAEEEAARVKVVQLDVDTNPLTTTRYGVLAMPTLILFRAGEPVKSMVGARPKRRLLQELDEGLADEPDRA
ncbi:thioredoxin fold domain-containing protein [Streptomyces sp. GMY02]|uniref:thioredoxin family protein n=1 Tax=Streptomyces sp. GMY02 TaxID=1333528 RepID=UPI001C2C0D50|nr:thioredoxin domain-containing protein [Streptomyces sp. GMY02]QXE34585.1 thioredoxin fold domain-containing protein [Streptomyces sp. GMY02]